MKMTVVILAVLALTLSACGKKDETPRSTTSAPTSTVPGPAAGVTVGAITLGNSIGPEKQVINASDSFIRNDTIYASVNTTGTGNTTLKAKWTYDAKGQEVPVHEDSLVINPTGPATSEFHVSKPDGWPAGAYKVEISTSGSASATRSFTVK